MSERIDRELTTVSSMHAQPTGTLREHVEVQTGRLTSIANSLHLIALLAGVFGLAISGLLIWIGNKL